MPSTGYVNGTAFGIFVGGTLISVATENSVNFTRSSIDVSNKDSGADKEYIYGRGDGTTSGTAKFKYDAGYGFTDLFTAMEAGTTVAIRYSNDTSGDKEYQFNALITELSMDNPDDSDSTISYSFQKTGAVTEATIA